MQSQHPYEISGSQFNAVYRQCRPHPTAFKSLRHRSKIGVDTKTRYPAGYGYFNNYYDQEELSLSLRPKQLRLNAKDPERTNGYYSPQHKNTWYYQKIQPSNLQADLGLDQGTLHWKTWRSFKEDVDSDLKDAEMYKITQNTFRQLTKQVKDVNMQMSRRYTGCGLKSYHSSNPSTSLVIHPSQLAASLPTHKPSIQEYKDWDTTQPHPSVEVICTSMKQEERKQRPKSHDVRSPRRCVVPPRRPKSSLPPSDRGKDNFDHLSSNIMGKLVGDANENQEPEFSGPFEIVAKGFYQQLSDSSDSEDGIDLNAVTPPHNPYSTTDLENLRWERFRQEKQYMEKKLLGVRLLPEVFNPEDSMFEYRTSNASSPELDPFPEALSEPFCYMDLLELSAEEDWRKAVRKVPEELEEELIMDRLIEMERFQEETSKLERKESLPSKKGPSVLEEKKGWNSVAAKPTERAHNDLDQKHKSKNCSENCLSVACAGNCSVKLEVPPKGCRHCYQNYCKGQCTEYGYHLHVRRPRDSLQKRPRPKSCHSCSKSGKKVLNTMNANNVILGRPRSAFSTFSSVQMTNVKPSKMACTNESDGGLVSQRLRKLQLKAPMEKEKVNSTPSNGLAPRRVKSARHLTGRDALLSGKSYHSQRKNSITTESCSTSAARCNSPSLRVQSAKYRRRLKSAKR